MLKKNQAAKPVDQLFGRDQALSTNLQRQERTMHRTIEMMTKPIGSMVLVYMLTLGVY